MSLSAVEDPIQTVVFPIMAEGKGLTVMLLLTEQPVGRMYIIFVVPGAAPDAMPEAGSIVAIDVPALLHVPPAEPSLSCEATPTQIVAGPVIAAGNGFTTTDTLVAQPRPSE